MKNQFRISTLSAIPIPAVKKVENEKIDGYLHVIN